MSYKLTEKNTYSNIGARIREKVIPAGVSVTKAAKLLGVGRPALSNLLNGNASLSPEMAQRLERAFGASSADLLRQQASLEAKSAANQGSAITIKPFVPTFLNFTSRDIEDWGNGRIATRSRLAVFIRKLVNSTTDGIARIDFPANDDSQRPGWDGYTEVSSGNSWVPSGKAGWELGTNSDPKPKADSDYTKSLKLPVAERKSITFVFVATTRWAGKKDWADNRCAEGQWKDVRAYDASDLEQWLEQSIPAQVWFSNETHRSARGALPLEAYWQVWSADCKPALVHSLFAEALGGDAAQKVAERLKSGGSVTVSADSRDEGVAFIDAAFREDGELRNLRDRVVLFSQPGLLPELISRNVGVIPIVTSTAVEQELAPYKVTVASIIIQPKNISSFDPDFSLNTLSYEAFNSALTEMGFSRDDIDRLSHESGRSITVLRRRLSNTDAIRTPNWSSDSRFSRFLIPIVLAGAWDSKSNADKDVLKLIRDTDDYESIERELLELLDLEDSPVWSVGTYRGLVSKMDALFAISKRITSGELERFLDIAALVLSEDDPALDLPDDERWMANIHGKKRDVSGPLRQGISETLVLLAVYSRELFGDRLGFDPALRVTLLVRNLLFPLTGRLLEAHSHDLPMYAEAAPDELLDILEQDLSQDEPATFEVVRPAGSGIWGTNPRTGLLWALENLAWAPERLIRVVAVLARLSEKKLEDNWVNKPVNSLGSLFRCWLPQTSAPIEGRIAALDYLVAQYPKVAWTVCVDQFAPGMDSASPNHKPRWRPDALGSGEGVSHFERHQMSRRALDLALGWKEHDQQTLSDLVRCVGSLPDEDQQVVWNLVSRWSQTALEGEKTILREVIRRSTMTKRARKKSIRSGEAGQTAKMLKAAKSAYEALQPIDVVLRHSWLFLNNWVEWSADELHGDDEDAIGDAREARIDEARRKAIDEVYSSEGYAGLVRLARVGEGGSQVGWTSVQVLRSAEELLGLVHAVLRKGLITDAQQERSLLSGLMHSAFQTDRLVPLLRAMETMLDHAVLQQVVLLAPFNTTTWDFVSAIGGGFSKSYWRDIRVGYFNSKDDGFTYAVDQLLAAGRPCASFDLIRFDLNGVPSKTIYRVLNEATSSTEDTRLNRLEGYHVREAFKRLNSTGEISVNDMASLEFQYLVLLDDESDMIPNLERQINENPEMFAQAVAFVFKRSDDENDPADLQAEDGELLKIRAKQAYRLLDQLTKIPGRDAQDKVNGKRLIEWINSARSSLKAWARSDVGDSQIGQLLAKSDRGLDGVWPCEQVREAMEKTLNISMASGFRIGKYNLRGVHFHAEGGSQERELASQYDGWASAVASSYPKVAKVLREMRDSYLRDAGREDTEAHIRRRLRH